VEQGRVRLEHEAERLLSDLRQGVEQLRVWDAEVDKLRAETRKTLTETQDLRRRTLEAERAEIRDLLLLFERAAFDAQLYSEEPVAMLQAFRATRIALQQGGASLIRNAGVARNFAEIRRLLWDAEQRVAREFPDVTQMADQLPPAGGSAWERREQVRATLGPQYYEPVRIMLNARSQMEPRLAEIAQAMRALDA
jgi:hypothetical protein